jgi:hypothetical protein
LWTDHDKHWRNPKNEQADPLMLAFAPHSVCSVRNPVTPGLKMNVMTSLAGPPTI